MHDFLCRGKPEIPIIGYSLHIWRYEVRNPPELASSMIEGSMIELKNQDYILGSTPSKTSLLQWFFLKVSSGSIFLANFKDRAKHRHGEISSFRPKCWDLAFCRASAVSVPTAFAALRQSPNVSCWMRHAWTLMVAWIGAKWPMPLSSPVMTSPVLKKLCQGHRAWTLSWTRSYSSMR